MRAAAGLTALPLLLIVPGDRAKAADRLTEQAIGAFVSARNDAIVRRDWGALRADYLPTAQIVGLYYDRGRTPHVHDGPADTDVTATAALMTKRTEFASKSVNGRPFVSPDGQRATVTAVLTVDYQAGGARVHRVFDDTLILAVSAGQPRIAQDISVERPPE